MGTTRAPSGPRALVDEVLARLSTSAGVRRHAALCVRVAQADGGQPGRARHGGGRESQSCRWCGSSSVESTIVGVRREPARVHEDNSAEQADGRETIPHEHDGQNEAGSWRRRSTALLATRDRPRRAGLGCRRPDGRRQRSPAETSAIDVRSPMISEDEWVNANKQLISEPGTEAYLRYLLSILKGGYPHGG